MNTRLKYLIIIGVALVVGWVIGFYSQPTAQSKTKKVYVDKIRKEVIHDTVKLTTPIYIEATKNDSLQETDSLNVTELDSILIEPTDTNEVIDEDIIREKLISSQNMEVEWITNDSIDVSELLNKKANSFNEIMVIEFWQSPLNLTGYELNRNKLKLFGFNPEESISLQVRDDKSELILRSRSFTLFLPKTNTFKTVNL